jgi:hypothetical protein
VQELWPHTLTWTEVDPGRRAFAVDGIEDAVLPLIPDKKSAKSEAWEEAITIALVQRYGRWACGWRWAGDEGSIGGGPIHSWCCPSHSLSTPAETAARVKSALVEWRAWLELLATRFVELAPREPTNTEVVSRSFEHAVVHLVAEVVAQTNAGDAWYAHCAQVLSWYLEALGVAAPHARGLIDTAIGGRFESWIAPDDSIIQNVACQVANGAAPHRVPR